MTGPSSNSGGVTPPLSPSSSSKSKIAQASKHARDKRKQEVHSLTQENERLREEREQSLKRIELLQTELVFQTSRCGDKAQEEEEEEKDDVDLQLENDHLRAQLSEHATFVSGLIKMSEGVPASSTRRSKSSQGGADYANLHILSLLMRSARQPHQWTRAVVPACADGLYISAHFQHVHDASTGLRRLHVRIDEFLPAPVTAEVACEVYWQTWTKDDVVRALFDNCGDLGGGAFPRRYYTDKINDDDEGHGVTEQLITLHTRKEIEHHVFVANKREMSVAKGSLVMGGRGGGEEMDGGRGLSLEDLAQPWKRQACVVCAGSNTHVRRIPLRPSATSSSSTTAAPAAADGIVNPAYVEGCVAWNVKGGGCRAATVVSTMEDYYMGEYRAFDLITQDGRMSDALVAICRGFLGLTRDALTTSAPSTAAAPKRARLHETVSL